MLRAANSYDRNEDEGDARAFFLSAGHVPGKLNERNPTKDGRLITSHYSRANRLYLFSFPFISFHCLLLSCRVGEDGDWDTNHALITLTNATSSQVIGLQPYQVYSFRVLAVNGLGVSAPSRESYYMVTLREGQ